MNFFGRATRLKIILSGVVLISSAYSLSASAKCDPVNGWKDKNINFQLPDKITVQRDDPVGMVLYTKDVPFTAERYIYCDSNTSTIAEYLNTWSPGPGGLTPTNVAGIGVKVYKFHSNGTATVYPSKGGYFYPGYGTWSSRDGFRIELIKTGSVTGGSLDTGAYAGFSTPTYVVAKVNVTGGGNIVSAACSVVNTSIPINMGNVKKILFAGVGSAAGERDFTIPLNCDASTKINITLDGTRHSSGVTGVIALDPAPGETVAQGVGLQLLFNNTPVTLGTAIAVGTATADGPYSVPLTARYLQTDGTVSAGKANSTATFTMTYN